MIPMLRIDVVVRNSSIPQIKEKLAQVEISNYSITGMRSNSKSFRPSFCIPRSTIQIICKSSQKELVLEAISGSGEESGIIYVNQLTPVITLNQQNPS